MNIAWLKGQIYKNISLKKKKKAPIVNREVIIVNTMWLKILYGHQGYIFHNACIGY